LRRESSAKREEVFTKRLDRGIKVRTDDIYALMGWREIMYLIGPRIIPLIIIVLLMPLVYPNMYLIRTVELAVVYALLSISWEFLSEYVGLVSLGHAYIIGVGAYLAAALNVYYGIPIFITIPVATVGGAAIVALSFLPCLPLRGIYFAIVTLAYPLLFARILEASGEAFLGGTLGLYGVEGFPNEWVAYYLLIIVFIISILGLRRLLSSDFGLIFIAIRDNDLAVEASGLNMTKYKTYGVFLASLPACFAGAYMAHLYLSANLGNLALDFSIVPIIAAVLGGMGMTPLVGSAVGAFIITPVLEFFRALGHLRMVVYSFFLVALIVIRSEGIVNYLWRKYHQFYKEVRI